MSKQLNVSQLKGFSPLDGLNKDNLRTLIEETKILDAEPGYVFFKEGYIGKRMVYVLSGTVELREGDQVVTTITGGTEEARTPLAPVLPRRYTALASDAVEYISVDSDSIDIMLTWEQTGCFDLNELRGEVDPTGVDEVNELRGEVDQTGADEANELCDEAGQIRFDFSKIRAEADPIDTWNTALLRLKAFHKIPPANIQGIFMRLQQIDVKAGEVVMRQGKEGDYFYVVTVGRCVVTRETSMSKEGIKLAELKVGDTFGEDALVSGSRRNATVTMETDGSLMRLGKEDFHTLLKEPMLDWVDEDEAERIVAAGGRWLDVRLTSEFEAYHENGAIHMPLYLIRPNLETLEPVVKYVVCCDTGRRSSAAAFMLNERGFPAYVLKGGLNRAGLDGYD